jgi:hypothetical protein
MVALFGRRSSGLDSMPHPSQKALRLQGFCGPIYTKIKYCQTFNIHSKAQRTHSLTADVVKPYSNLNSSCKLQYFLSLCLPQT